MHVDVGRVVFEADIDCTDCQALTGSRAPDLVPLGRTGSARWRDCRDG